MVVSERKNILVQLSCLLLIQRQKVVLGLNLSLLFELLAKFLLLSTRPPDGLGLVVRVLVDTAHPLEATQLLVSVDCVIVLVFLLLLLFLLSLALLCSLVNITTAALCRLLAF